MKSGTFIALEGVEGSGKSTLLTPLKEHYENAGKKVLVTREPGGTDLGNELRNILLHFDKETISPVAELLMIEASRAQHMTQVVANALVDFDLVLCDRFTLSTLAYQWGGRGLPRETVEGLNRVATGGIEPDLVALLDLPVEVALGRRRKRRAQDRFEDEEIGFHRKVRDAYLALAAEHPKRIPIFDATLAPDALLKAVVSRINLALVRHE